MIPWLRPIKSTTPKTLAVKSLDIVVTGAVLTSQMTFRLFCKETPEATPVKDFINIETKDVMPSEPWFLNRMSGFPQSRWPLQIGKTLFCGTKTKAIYSFILFPQFSFGGPILLRYFKNGFGSFPLLSQAFSVRRDTIYLKTAAFLQKLPFSHWFLWWCYECFSRSSLDATKKYFRCKTSSP